MGAAVAAILLAQERRLVDAFARAGATSPTTARLLHTMGISDERAVRRLHRHAVLRETAPGVYYLDVEVWEAVRRTRRRMVLILGIVILTAAIVLAVFGK